MNSRTLVMDESGALEERTIELPELGANEVLVRVELTGVCGSDIHMRAGGMDLEFPVVPGHELAGVVEEIGDGISTDSKGDRVAVGDSVTVCPGYNNSEDWYTKNLPTRPLACSDRNVYGFRGVADAPHAHGGMSEYLVVEEEAYFYRLPDDMPTELGAIVEPLSVATHALERAYRPGLPNVREGFGLGKTVAVQGAGPIGLLTVAAADAAGAGTIISVDVVDERLEMAERFGATDTVDLSEYDGGDDLASGVKELTPGGVGPDAVIEAVGQPVAFGQAIEMVRDAGTIVEVGHYADAGTVEVNPTTIVQKELDIYGSLAYPPTQFETAIAMLAKGADEKPYDELFDFKVGFDRAEAAYDKQASGEAYRATVHPGR